MELGGTHRHGPHGHTHSPLLDPELRRSREGLRVVATSLGVLALTALVQGVIYTATDSVALLADLLHNVGDALTALPLGTAFLLRSRRAEYYSGYGVVAAIAVSALIAAAIAVYRIVHPLPIQHLFELAFAGVVGFAGNEIASRVRLRAGLRLNSAALVADGKHARVDGLVSLAVVASAIVVGLGLHIADPLIGLAITVAILRITVQSWRIVAASAPGASSL